MEKETTLSQGQETASNDFSFTNEGKDPVSISSVRASCGCTVPEYSQNIIMPSSTGKVKLEYHAHPPGMGKNVSASVQFSDGSTSSLVWRIVSAASTDQPRIPLVSWGSGDMAEKTVTLDIPPGHKVDSPVAPPEVEVTTREVEPGKVEVVLSRKSETPFWGAVKIRTTPPLEDQRTRINVRASP